jgi:hypothetical protein
MWMHLKASFAEQLSRTEESTKSIALPSFHKLHGWTNSRKFIGYQHVLLFEL